MLKTLQSTVKFGPLRWRATDRALMRAVNVDALRHLARRRLPRGIFDYIDGGAEDEVTLHRNVTAFRDLEFRPRVLADVAEVDTSATVLGRRLPIPAVLAPTGFTRMVTPAGELDVARAADRAGLPYTLSSLSTRSIEEVRSVSGGDLWFQVYVWRDKGLLLNMLERAAKANYSTIVITVDTAVLGRRERDIARGFTLPPKLGLRVLADGLRHPAWTWRFIRSEPIRFANLSRDAEDGSSPVKLADYVNSQFDPTLSWRDITWFREQWPGRIILKGIQRADDAKIAVDHGVDGIVVSNHGGRQLDGAPVPIEVLPLVVEAVGDSVTVFCDGGVRRGGDIVKALSLGANATFIGRPYLYGLAAAGSKGVEHVLTLFEADIARVMALLGVSSTDDLTGDCISIRRTS